MSIFAGDGGRALQQRISAQRDDAVALLQDLVRIPSITGDEANVGRFVTDFIRSMGLEVEVLEAAPGRPNLVATWDSGKPGPTLLLNDHLDIIPPGPLEYWTHPPFAADIADGMVYGRGTIDTKSGVTTLLMATRALRQSGLPIHGKLRLVFTCDEEVGGEFGAQYVGKLGYFNADMALVAEPTSLQVEIATKGRLNIEVTTRGVATHGARPWLGHNAIEDMMLVIQRLQVLYQQIRTREKHPLLGLGALNIGIIEGGTVPNMVPNKCRMEVDRRVLPSEEPAQALQEFQQILDELQREHPKLDASVKQLLWWPGYEVSPDAQIVRVTCRAFEKVTGRTPNVVGKDAGTDASWISKLGGTPVVMFSPGDGPRAMNADESVRIDDLITATQVVGQVLYDVLAVADDANAAR